MRRPIFSSTKCDGRQEILGPEMPGVQHQGLPEGVGRLPEFLGLEVLVADQEPFGGSGGLPLVGQGLFPAAGLRVRLQRIVGKLLVVQAVDGQKPPSHFQMLFGIRKVTLIVFHIRQDHHQLAAAGADLVLLVLAEILVENRRRLFRGGIELHQAESLARRLTQIFPKVRGVGPHLVHVGEQGGVVGPVEFAHQFVRGEVLLCLHQNLVQFGGQVCQLPPRLLMTGTGSGQCRQPGFQSVPRVLKAAFRHGDSGPLQRVAPAFPGGFHLPLHRQTVPLGHAVGGVKGDAAPQHHQDKRSRHPGQRGQRLVAPGPFDSFLPAGDRPGFDRVPTAECRQVLGHFIRSLVSLFRVFFQGLQGDRLQVDRHRGVQVHRSHRILFPDVLQGFQQGPPLERGATGQKLVQDRPQRIDIRNRGQLLGFALGLLGRHVAGRSHDRAGAGVAVLRIQLLGQAEVGHLGQIFLGQQHVGRLEVAVDDFQRMRVRHGPAHLLHHLGGELRLLGLTLQPIV